MDMSHISEIVEYLRYLLSGILIHFPMKLFVSSLAAISGFFFGVDIDSILLALLTLVFFDFVTGIAASHKQDKPIKSRVALRSAVKLSVYGLLVSSAHLTEMAVPGYTFMPEGMVAFLAITELISIIENVGVMGHAIPRHFLKRLQRWRDNEKIE
jgi:phage-related holin